MDSKKPASEYERGSTRCMPFSFNEVTTSEEVVGKKGLCLDCVDEPPGVGRYEVRGSLSQSEDQHGMFSTWLRFGGLRGSE